MYYDFKEVPNDLVKQFKDELEFGIFECDQSITIDGLDPSELFDYGNQICYTYCEEAIGVANVYISNKFLSLKEVFYFFDDISEGSSDMFTNAISKKADHKKLVTTQKFAYIHEIKVHPQFRGIGLGKNLLLSIEKFLESLGVKVIYLISGVLEKGSKPPHEFYEKLGYELLFIDEESDYKGYFKLLHPEPNLLNIFRKQHPQIYIEDYFIDIPDEVQEALEFVAEIYDYRFVLNRENFLAIGVDYQSDMKVSHLSGLLNILKNFTKSLEDLMYDELMRIRESQEPLNPEDAKYFLMLQKGKNTLEQFISNKKA